MSMHTSIPFTKYCILKLRILVINYSYESDVKPSKFNILKNIATLHLYLLALNKKKNTHVIITK